VKQNDNFKSSELFTNVTVLALRSVVSALSCMTKKCPSFMFRNAHSRTFLRGFWDFDPLNVVRYCRDPHKAHPWPETRIVMYRSKKVKKKERKKKRNFWDLTSHIFAQTTHIAIPHQSCHVDWGSRRSEACKVLSKIKIGSGFLAPWKIKIYLFAMFRHNMLGLPPNLWFNCCMILLCC